MNFLLKLIFLWRKPKIIIVTGNNRETTVEAIFCLLNQNFKVARFQEKVGDIFNIIKNEILIVGDSLTESPVIESIKFLARKSQLPLLVVNQFGDSLPSKDTSQSKKIAKILPAQAFLIRNFDDETLEGLKENTNLQEVTFGFQEGADFQISDIKLNSGTNFKINHKGNIVPIWLGKPIGKEQIYSTLAAAAVGTILGLNLVEISSALKNYNPVLEKM